MLAFFRRVLSSWVVVALLGLVMIAFIVTGVGTPSGLGGFGGPGAGNVATVGGEPVSAAEVARRADTQLTQARQQQPTITMTQLLAAIGGPGALVENVVTGKLLSVYARRIGLAASDRLVDGELASIPAFQGPTGKFDQRQMEALLAQQHIALPGLRDGIRDDLLRGQLLSPLAAGTTPSAALVRPYAALLVAMRQGQIGFVPATPDAAKPSEADVAAWYKGHVARYSLPERRTLRYAAATLENVPVTPPSDADIAARYKANAAAYGPSETRTLSQVVLPDEGAAKAFAAKVAGGTPFAKAAADAGFGAGDIAVGAVTKAAFASSSAPAVADAAFAAAGGAVTAPVKSPLGWHVVKVEAIEAKPARTLAQVRGQIADGLLAQRRTDALAKLTQKINDAVDGGASFDEVVQANRLQVVTSPAITAAGAVPTDAGFKPDAMLQALLKPGFAAAPEDDPTLETVVPGQRFALLKVAGVAPAAPQPLAQVRAQVERDLVADRAAKKAEAGARSILAKIDGGQPLAAALAAAGLPPAQPIALSQVQLLQARQAPPPPLRALFTLTPGRSTVAQGPNGWYVVHLDRIAEGAPALLPVIAGQMRAELGRSLGDEYVEQFARAAKDKVKVRYNSAAINELGRQLAGQAPATP